eukprot:12929326-Prorocentrum_lima.AAC.1
MPGWRCGRIWTIARLHRCSTHVPQSIGAFIASQGPLRHVGEHGNFRCMAQQFDPRIEEYGRLHCSHGLSYV